MHVLVIGAHTTVSTSTSLCTNAVHGAEAGTVADVSPPVLLPHFTYNSNYSKVYKLIITAILRKLLYLIVIALKFI